MRGHGSPHRHSPPEGGGSGVPTPRQRKLRGLGGGTAEACPPPRPPRPC